ncbi:UNVERIFIED_CONTAM: spop [Trichonephila clavipes]
MSKFYAPPPVLTVKQGKGYIFTWEIENYSMHFESYIDSPVFQTPNGMLWGIILYPDGFKEKNHIGLRLLRIDNIGYNKFWWAAQFSLVTALKVVQPLHPPESRCRWDTDVINGDYMTKEEFMDNSHLFLPKDKLTVQCRISRLPEKEYLSKGCSITSHIEVNHLTAISEFPFHKWSKSKKSLAENTSSRIQETPFILTFDPQWNSNDESMKVTFTSKKGLSAERSMLYRLRIDLLDVDENVHTSVDEVRLFHFTDEEIWTFAGFIKKKDLIEMQSMFAKDGYFALRFEKYLALANTELCTCEITYHQKERPKRSRFCKDLALFYQNTHPCTDLKIKADGKMFLVYKAIICSRSPVFKAMMKSDMLEKEEDAIDITDIDSETMGRMIHFLYSGKLENDMDCPSVLELYAAAHKYMIEELKKECSGVLRTMMSKNNCRSIRNYAEIFSDNELKDIIQEWIDCISAQPRIQQNSSSLCIYKKWFPSFLRRKSRAAVASLKRKL